jgi:hypothetical protein
MSLQRFSISCLFFTAILSCSDPQNDATKIQINMVTPSPASQGSVIEVQGKSFGNQSQTLAFEGRPLQIISWTPQSILAQVPMDTPVGDGYLVIHRLGENSQPFAFNIQGEAVNRESNRTFSDYRMTTNDALPLDALIDLSVDQNVSNYEYEMNPIVENADVVLFPKINSNQQLLIEVQLKNQVNPWGMAFHFTYPSDRLKLVPSPEHDPLLNQDFKKMKMVKEAKAGYLMLFSAYPQEVVFSLTFDIIQTGDLLFEFPLRGRMFKDENQKSKQLTWGSAILTLKEKGR